MKSKPVLKREEDADCKCSMWNFWVTAGLHGTYQNEFISPRTSIIGDKNKPKHQENMTRNENHKNEESLWVSSSTIAFSGGANI